MDSNCPNCRFERADGVAECPRCGVVFGKLRHGVRESAPPAAFIEPEGRNALLAGFAIALTVMFLPFVAFVFSYLTTLVHELGHAIGGWLFGYPSIPGFDFQYGGGVTRHEERKVLLLLVIYALFAWGIYSYRRRPATLIALGAVLAVYSLCAFTELHRFLIVALGHGAELLFAGIFLYRAVSGAAVTRAVERPLYAFVGFFIVFSDLRFAHNLMTSAAGRAEYEAAKGGGHWMDFSVLAEQHLNTELSTVAAFFLLACALPLVGAVLFHRSREAILERLARLLGTPAPDESVVGQLG